MARLIGSDRPASNRQYLDQISQEQGKQFQILSQGLAQARQTSADLTNSAIAANQAQADIAKANAFASAQQHQQSTSNLNDFLGLASVGVEFGNAMQKQAAEQAQLVYKQQQEKEYADARMRVAELKRRGQELVLGDGGYDAYKTEAYNIISDYSTLSAKQAADLFEDSYKELTALEKKRVNTQLGEQGKLRDSLINQEKSRLGIRISGILEQMEVSRDPRPLMQQFDSVVKNFVDNSQLSDPVDLAQLIAYALEEVGKSSRLGIATQAALTEKYNNIQQFLKIAGQASIQHANNPMAQKQVLYQAATQLGLPFAEAYPMVDPTEAMRHTNEYYQLQQNMTELRRNQLVTKADAEALERPHIASLALAFFNDPARQAQMKEVMGNNGDFQAIVAVKEAMINYRDTARRVAVKQDSLAETIASFNLATEQIRSGNGMESVAKPLSILEKFLEVTPTADPTLAKAMQSAPEISLGLTPEQRKEALAKQMEWRATITQLLENRMGLIQQELIDAQTGLNVYAPYGLLNYERYDDPVLIESTDQAYQNQVEKYKRINEAASQGIQQQQPRGFQGSFNKDEFLSKFAYVKNRYGKAIVLPFPKGTKNWRYGEGVSGKSSHYKRTKHAGLDIAVPMNTPILSPIKGQVVKVVNDTWGGGYGRYVTIKDDATGTYHRFAHNSRNDVKTGDTVDVGQQIGLIGSTGRSTGAHLHYEVRSSHSYYMQDTYDPEQWWATRLENMTPTVINQPRMNNVAYYQNRESPYANTTTNQDFVAPADSYLLDGYMYLRKNVVINEQGQPTPAKQVFNKARPMEQSYAPSTKDSSPVINQPSDYGYAALARSPNKMNKIHEIAKRLDALPVWLADVMALESSSEFSTSIVNKASNATGLIQFIPSTAKALGTSVEALKRMSFEQQMEYVYKYLGHSEFKTHGGFNDIGDIAAAVWGGGKLFRLWNTDRKRALEYGYSDGRFKFRDYLKRLGANANRQYKIPELNGTISKVKPVHTTAVKGCPICDQMLASGSEIVPHRAA